MSDNISPKQFRESEGVDDWRVLGDGANAYFRTASFAAGVRLVQAINELPGFDENRPEVDLRHDGVTVRMLKIAEDYAGMTRGHVELARRISAAARKLGFSADPSAVQSLLVIPGATDRAKVMPFWRAVLGYEPRRDSPAEDLVDPPRSCGAVLVRANEGAARGRRWRDPHCDLGAVRAGRGANRGGAGRRRADGARPVRAVVVDAGRRCGERGRHRHDKRP